MFCIFFMFYNMPGKTYSMEGPGRARGVNYRAVASLFAWAHTKNVTLKATYLAALAAAEAEAATSGPQTAITSGPQTAATEMVPMPSALPAVVLPPPSPSKSLSRPASSKVKVVSIFVCFFAFCHVCV